MSQLTKEQLQKIASSILAYQSSILEDINLSLRLHTEDEKVYTTCLTKWNGAHLFFEAPLVQRDYISFLLPYLLDCHLITKKAVFKTRLNLIDRHRQNDKLIYKAEIISPLIKAQQRQHFRLATLTPLDYRILKRASDIPYDEKLYPGTSVNISVGGLCMVSNHQLLADDHLLIHMAFVNTSFTLEGHVLSDGERHENGTYSHRIRFLNMNSQIENTLSKLIFEKQRLMMRSSKMPLYPKR